MNIKSSILCVFEGEVREPLYFNGLKQCFFDEQSIVYCCFGNNIYELHSKMQEDEDLDIFEVIQEYNTVESNKDLFEKFSRDDFSQVFLFFDFEFHDDKFSSEDLTNMVETFDEETEFGKLFVSYPMVEAIRDVPCHDSFIEHRIKIEQSKGKVYKGLSTQGMTDYLDPRKIDERRWIDLIRLNVEKGNFILDGARNNFKNPEQSDVLDCQIKLVEESNELYVLSAFPLFVYHQKGSQFNFAKQ
jgi:hypothetical protein